MIHSIDKQSQIKCLLNKHYFENTVRREIKDSLMCWPEDTGLLIMLIIAAINPIETLDIKYAIKDAIKIEVKKHIKKLSIVQRIMMWFK